MGNVGVTFIVAVSGGEILPEVVLGVVDGDSRDVRVGAVVWASGVTHYDCEEWRRDLW